MHRKGLVTHFQKMAFFIMLRLTVSEILGFEVENTAESASFLIF